MASAGAIRAGAAYVELSTQDSKLVKGLRGAEQRLKAWGASIAGVGAKLAGLGTAALTALFGAAKVFADMGSDLLDMSQRTGVSVEALSELGFAADQSGADMQTLEAGLRRMQQLIADAAGGSDSARQALDLGISVEDLSRLSPDEQFKLIADRLSQINNPTMRAAAAMDIFGRSGTRLLPMLANGAAGIEAMQQQARDLGLTWSTEDAQAGEAFGDTLDRLWKVLKRAVSVIGAALVPILSTAIEWIIQAASTVAKWINENRDLIVTVFQIAVAITAGGLALMLLGNVIAGVGAAFGVLATTISGIGTVIGLLGTVLGAILSPLGLIITAVVALGGYLLYASGVGEQALTWLGDQFGALRDTALAAWQGISDALAAGDICLAARILWLTLKLIWQQGIAWLEEKWLAFKGFFIETFYNAVFGVARFLNDAWAGIQVAWIETVTFLANAWTQFISGLMRAWNRFSGFFQRVWARVRGMLGGNAEAEIANINSQEAQRDQEIVGNRDRAMQEREQERQRRRGAIEQERAAVGDELGRMQGQERQQRQAQQQAQMGEAQGEVDRARQEWQDALNQARQRRQEADAARPQRMQRPGELPDIESVVDTAQKKVDVQGTFNALAIRGLGASNLAERTARATEQTATNTRRLLERARDGGLAFA